MASQRFILRHARSMIVLEGALALVLVSLAMDQSPYFSVAHVGSSPLPAYCNTAAGCRMAVSAGRCRPLPNSYAGQPGDPRCPPLPRSPVVPTTGGSSLINTAVSGVRQLLSPMAPVRTTTTTTTSVPSTSSSSSDSSGGDSGGDGGDSGGGSSPGMCKNPREACTASDRCCQKTCVNGFCSCLTLTDSCKDDDNNYHSEWCCIGTTCATSGTREGFCSDTCHRRDSACNDTTVCCEPLVCKYTSSGGSIGRCKLPSPTYCQNTSDSTSSVDKESKCFPNPTAPVTAAQWSTFNSSVKAAGTAAASSFCDSDLSAPSCAMYCNNGGEGAVSMSAMSTYPQLINCTTTSSKAGKKGKWKGSCSVVRTCN